MLWQQVVVESNAPWLPTLITNERGQYSTVLRLWLKADRDTWKCALRGDAGVSLAKGGLFNGPRLRSRTINVTLTLANDEMPVNAPARLEAVEVRGALDTSPLQQ